MSDAVSDARHPRQPQVGVGAVVFHEQRILLVQRRDPPAAGQWAIPGGKLRLGETLQQAAEREIREETGLIIRAGEPVWAFDLIEREPDGRVRWHYVIIDLAAEYLAREPRAGDDALAVRWVAADELADLPVNASTRRLLRERFDFGP